MCAVSYADVTAAVRTLAHRSTEIVSLRPDRLDDVWRDVETVGAAAGVAAHGRVRCGRASGSASPRSPRARQASRGRGSRVSNGSTR